MDLIVDNERTVCESLERVVNASLKELRVRDCQAVIRSCVIERTVPGWVQLDAGSMKLLRPVVFQVFSGNEDDNAWYACVGDERMAQRMPEARLAGAGRQDR